MGEPETSDRIAAFLNTWQSELPRLYQNRLLDSNDLARFAETRGIQVGRAEPLQLYERGWLAADDHASDGSPRFHPFRMYPLHRVLQACSLRITATSTLDREKLGPFLSRVVTSLPDLDTIGQVASRANRAVALPILLEPAQWPALTGRISFPGLVREEDHRRLHDEYHAHITELVRQLDMELWRRVHEEIRFQAAAMDENDEIYLLLRLAPWDRRDHVSGRIGGALWLRHVAEVLRRSFEETHHVQWPEEDHGFGMWMQGAREREYGSDRPLDHPTASKPYLAFAFGLHTGSIVRWYLEGDTELGAIKEVLPGAATGGIELVNFRGSLETKHNAPLKLADSLQQDLKLRRFSFLTFDLDEPETVRTIRGQIRKGNVVGAAFAHDPDFEFANFDLPELVEIAATIDDEAGFDGDLVRAADWSGVARGRAFEKRYSSVSSRGRSLKGLDWGATLAKYALAHPLQGSGKRRPFLESIDTVLHSRIVRYDYHKAVYSIDPNTFAVRRVAEPDDPWRL